MLVPSGAALEVDECEVLLLHRHRMCVDAQREFSVGVTELLGDPPHRTACGERQGREGVPRGVKPERPHAIPLCAPAKPAPRPSHVALVERRLRPAAGQALGSPARQQIEELRGEPWGNGDEASAPALRRKNSASGNWYVKSVGGRRRSIRSRTGSMRSATPWSGSSIASAIIMRNRIDALRASCLQTLRYSHCRDEPPYPYFVLWSPTTTTVASAHRSTAPPPPSRAVWPRRRRRRGLASLVAPLAPMHRAWRCLR